MTLKCRILWAPMFDDEEAVEQLECNRRHREQVKRHDDLAMGSVERLTRLGPDRPAAGVRKKTRAAAKKGQTKETRFTLVTWVRLRWPTLQRPGTTLLI